LLIFDTEHLDNMDHPDLVDDADIFVDTMIGVLMTTTVHGPTQGSGGIGIEIMKLCYVALLGLFERQPSIWQAFVAHEGAVGLHLRILLDDNLHQIAGHIINICRQTTNQAIPDFYVLVMTSVLPQALARGVQARSFYRFASDVLYQPETSSVRSDQARARELVDSVTKLLWTYEHSESIDLPIIDSNMLGLLTVVDTAIQILRSFKVSLRLDDFSVKVFQTFLFSEVHDGLDRTLIDKRTRKAAFHIVEQTCESAACFDKLCSTASTMLQASRNCTLEAYCHPDWARPASHCAGLDNLGMTCYMNSLIQQLYANLHFRRFIFETPILDNVRQACLVEVQILFARMQAQAHRSIRPVDLAKTLNIRTDSQEDVHGFYEDFISRLETEMPDEKSKAALTEMFTGCLLSQIKGECGHVSTRTEPFVDLPVLVKNKPGLKESLDELVQGEPMEGANKYKCLACDPMGEGRLVDAMKRACPEKIPNNLTFCLKRFSFEAMFNMDDKVNDRFEFPQTIDMAAYHHTKVEDPSLTCEPDLFELVGVIVHQGTLQFGHYWSYTLLRNTSESTSRVWTKLEDKNATICPNGFDTIQRECFGGEWFTNGQERTDNAYVLFYQRRAALEEPLSTLIPARDPTTGELLPARVKLPEHLEMTISQENREHYLANHLADHAFVEFVKWLMQKSQSLSSGSTPDPDSGESEEGLSPRSAHGNTDLVAAPAQAGIAGVVMALVQRLASCAMAPMSELPLIADQLKSMIRIKPSLAYLYLDRFLQDGNWTELLTLDGRNMRRLGLSDVVQCLFTSLREADPLAYRGIFEKMCTQFQSLFESKRENSRQLNWLVAFDMIGWLAAQGPWETTQILRHGFLRFAFNMLYLPWSESLQADYPLVLAFMKRRPGQVSSVYRFITLVLGLTWIRMDDMSDNDDALSLFTEDGTVCLSPELVKYIHGIPSKGSMSFWMQSAALADKDGQEHFTPAKLMSLLLTSEYVPDFIKQSIPLSLNVYIDKEDAALRPIILMVEEFCVACGDDVRAADAMKHLALTIDSWPQGDREFMPFVARVYTIAPRAVADNIALWYAMYIHPGKKPTKAANLCNDVAQWLRNTFFAAISMTDQVFEAKRIQLARRMIGDLTPQIHSFYDQEQPRSECEPAIIVLEGIGDYIELLARRIEAMPRRSVTRGLQIQYDEVTRDVEDLKEINSLVADWETDSPSQYFPVRDGASDGSVISDEDEDVEATAWIDDEDVGA
jgi:ubiquitin carboxyl-terminal hydrolase 34